MRSQGLPIRHGPLRRHRGLGAARPGPRGCPAASSGASALVNTPAANDIDLAYDHPAIAALRRVGQLG